VTGAGAYEAYPGHGDFTVDKLLAGHYDQDLSRLAQQFREFGKPMFFATAREPNVVLADYLGGFGPDGDKSTSWAMQNDRTLTEFTPPAGPAGNPDLYAGLGLPDACDGLERLAAAQRYYHDFFVRREEIDFLTFESMGWSVSIPSFMPLQDGPCVDWAAFYRMIGDTVDWVSFNWYMATDEGLPQPPISTYLDELRAFMHTVRQTAPGKPVLITELGFCGPDQGDKVSQGLHALIHEYPEIHGFIQWADLNPEEQGCGLSSGEDGTAFRRVVDANPDRFHSCVSFSDGSLQPNCRS
jgi:hypothetical protein